MQLHDLVKIFIVDIPQSIYRGTPLALKFFGNAHNLLWILRLLNFLETRECILKLPRCLARLLSHVIELRGDVTPPVIDLFLVHRENRRKLGLCAGQCPRGKGPGFVKVSVEECSLYLIKCIAAVNDFELLNENISSGQYKAILY